MGLNSKSNPPRVLAVIVNWNKIGYLRNLLASLRTLGGSPFDILVVDNASSDGSPDMVRTEFPECALLETGANLGGTGGFNAGMTWGLRSEKDYEFLWLMDNDIVVHPGALDALLEAMGTDAKIGLVGSTILIMETPNRVQEIGARVDWSTAGLMRNCETEFSKVPRPQLLECDYVAACSALVRVEAARETGLWDPNYFIAWDDIYWGVLMKRARWRVVATTESVVEHEGYSDRRISSGAGASYIWMRNCLYFIHRNAPPKWRARALFHQFRLAHCTTDNLKSDGRHSSARVTELAIDHFFRDRLSGPPPKELAALKDAPREFGPLPRLPLRRIVLLVIEHHHVAAQFIETLKAEYPDAQIDVLVPDSSGDTLRSPIPAARMLSLRSVAERFGFAMRLLFGVDAIAAHALAPRYAFELLAKHSIRYDGQLLCEVRRRSVAGYVAKGLRRATISARAFALTIRALMKPVRPVAYPEQVVAKDAKRAEPWRRREEDGALARAGVALAAIVLLPLALASAAVAGAAMPLLRSRDEAKGRLGR